MIVNKQQFAELSGFSSTQIKLWIEDGMPCEAPKKGRAMGGFIHQIDTTRAIPWLLRRYKTLKKTRPSSELFKHEQARRVALDNGVKMRALVRFSEMELLIRETVSMLSNELEGLPGRLANELAGITDAARIRLRILEEVRRVRANFSKRVLIEGPDQKTATDYGGDDETAADPDSERVGGREESLTPRKRRARSVAKRSRTVDRRDSRKDADSA